jgi:SNF2 family DNA or RNA helicase
MRLFHLGWLNGHLHLWGETSETDIQIEEPSAEQLPRACRAAVLADLLHEKDLDSTHEPETLIAWLPTVDGGAVPSSSVLGNRPEENSEPVLAPWQVPALPLDRAAAVDLLGHCHDRRMLAPGRLIGNDLSYWAHVVRFAGAMVAREQVLPGLQERNGIYRARWEPVVRGEETERVATLVDAMPPACRALSQSEEAPPASSSRDVFLSVLGDLADFIVRAGRNGRSFDTESPRGAASFDSLHDQWLHALRAPDGRMTGDDDQLAHLAGQLRAWRRRIEVTADAPFRLVFRLEEPDVDEEAVADDPGLWHVRYLLQSTRDPSLQIDVAEAWDPEASTQRVFERADFRPESYLLAALGQAMGVWPAIEDSLKAPNPAGLELDTEQAHAFLREYAPLLRQSGFGVQLPAWWKRGRTKETLSTKANAQAPDMKAKGGLSLDTIVQFDWEVALGDHVLSREELDELAEMKTPLVHLRGEWVEVDLDAIREVAERLDRQETDQFTAREVMNMALGARDGPGGLSVEEVSASGALGELLDRLDEGDTVEPLPEPDGFSGTLRPYQERGYAWLAFLKRWGLGACLADDMGLGKTIQALALLRRTYNGAFQNGDPDEGSEASTKPSLVVCPTSVVSNWKKEANRFTPGLSVLVHHGSDRDRTEEAFLERVEDHHLTVTNYALLRRDVDLFRALDWNTVVLDEAQYVKNPSAQRTQAARSLTAQHRIAMTGTPVENNVGELWSIMEILNPGLLGSQKSFKNRFFRPIQNERDVEAMRDLKRITGPFILRREKTDPKVIDDLPEKQEMTVYTSLTEEQVSLYQAVVKETTAALEGEKSELDMERRGLVLSTLTQLKQICNHPAQYLHDDSQIAGRSGKLSRLVEMLEEMLAAGERALIFTQFTEMGDLLKRHLQETFGREALFLHGGVKQEKRDRMVTRFQEADDPPPFFLLSLKAGGTGLNLTRASHVFHYDRWWNPAVENQATDRAFRIGQTQRVQVHKFVCAGTLEERIDEMIERKKTLAEQVVDAGEDWVTELSTDELKDLFRLRQSEV